MPCQKMDGKAPLPCSKNSGYNTNNSGYNSGYMMVMMVELPVISQIQEVFSGECHEIIRHLTCFPVKV